MCGAPHPRWVILGMLTDISPPEGFGTFSEPERVETVYGYLQVGLERTEDLNNSRVSPHQRTTATQNTLHTAMTFETGATTLWAFEESLGGKGAVYSNTGTSILIRVK